MTLDQPLDNFRTMKEPSWTKYAMSMVSWAWIWHQGLTICLAFWISGLGFLDLDFWILISGFRFLDFEFWIWISGFEFLDLDLWIWTSVFECLDLNFWMCIPGFLDSGLTDLLIRICEFRFQDYDCWSSIAGFRILNFDFWICFSGLYFWIFWSQDAVWT